MLLTGVAPFGAWAYCDKCKTSCDAIKLYGLAYKLASPEHIIAQLTEDLNIKSLSATDQASYCSFHDTYYTKIQHIWTKAAANMHPMAHRGAISRLSELNLWTSQEVFNKAFLNWFGYMNRYELEELLEAKLPGIPKYAEGVLIMPFFIKPGFICGFGLIGPKDQMAYLNMFVERACGFCGLYEATVSKAKETYILPTPLQAARIYHKCTLERYDKLAVTAKGAIGDLDCTSIRNKPILWQEDSDDEFLKTCIASKGFKILSHETPYIWKPKEKNSALWQSNLMPIIHREINQLRLQNPVDYLVSELLHRGFGKAKISLENMGLNEFQRNLIIAACPQEAQVDLKEIMESAVSSVPVLFGKKAIFERDGKMWISGSREIADEEACNFTMRVSNICRNKEDGSGVIFGSITVNTKILEFQTNEEELEENPKKILSVIFVAAGITSPPYIAESIRKKFLDIILRFSVPQVHSVQNYVGYDPETQKFSMPLVAVDTQTIKIGMPFVIANPPIPCANLIVDANSKLPNIKHLFLPSLENSAYLAGMTCVLSAIYNNIEHNTRTNTLLMGVKGSLSEYIFDVIRLDLGLVTVCLNSKAELDLAKEVSITHQVPVAIDGIRSQPRLLSQWLEGQGGNSLVITNSLNAAALGLDKDWNFVRADLPCTGESLKLLNSEQAFPFLLQFLLTTRPASSIKFLEALEVLIAGPLAMPNNSAAVARHLISEHGLLNTRAPGVNLISFIQEGVEAGVFKTFTGVSTKKGYIIVNNPIKDTVTIHLTNLLGQTRLLNLPLVPWEAAIDQLKKLGASPATEEGKSLLVCPKPLWNSMVAAVKRMKSMRKAYLGTL